MTYPLLYQSISIGIALLYWPMFFLSLYVIEKANEIKT